MNKLASNKKLCVLSVFLSGCFWGITGLFVRFLAHFGFNALQVACMRNVTAPVILVIIALIKDKSLPKMKLKDLPVFLGSGIISMFLTGVCYFEAMELSSVSVACILMYTAPVFVIFLSYFIFKEKIGAKKITAALIAFLGCVLVSGVFDSQQKMPLASLLFGIGSGISYAFYGIFSKIAINRGYKPFDVTFFSFLLAGIFSLFFCDFSLLASVASNNVWMIGFYPLTGLVASVLPYMLYTLGLSGLESTAASVISCSEPMVACLVSVFILSEPMTPLGLLGIVLITASIIILG